MGNEPAFADVDDTPMFRQRVDDLEGGVKRLKDKCTSFISASRRYRESIENMGQAQHAFAGALQEFCGGGDEESLLLGGAVMSRFVKVFKDLAELQMLLCMQVDVSVCEHLQETWLDDLLAHVKEDHRKYDKKVAEHEAARMRYLAMKKVTRKEVLERAQAELAATRTAAEDARFDLARRLNQVEQRKKHTFLEAMISSMHGHLKHFEHGNGLLQKQAPFIQHSLEIVDHLKREEQVREAVLEEMIAQHREQGAQREVLLQQMAAPDDNHQGPLQMTSFKAVLTGEVEALIRATKESGGAQVTIIKQGYLFKRSGQMRADWKRRFFVLDSQGMLYYYSHRDTGLLTGLRREKPKNTVNLLTSTIKLDDEERCMRFCFRVVSPEGTYTLQAENELERQEWIDAVQVVINCLLNGDISVEAMPRKPSRPTHSRNSSYSDYETLTQQIAAGSPLATQPAPRPGTPPAHPDHPDYMPLSPLASSPPNTPPSGEPSAPGFGLPPLGRGKSSNLPRSDASKPLPPLERLQRVEGNKVCCDCGAPSPDWASLNLGVLMCIECSGIHRKMGVHVSKVRSLTLDVRVWDTTMLALFEAIGNQYANQVYEAHLMRSLNKADSWIWCDNSDDEEGGGSSRRATGGAAPLRNQRELMLEEGGTPYVKPGPSTDLAEKERFIKDKWASRAFAGSQPPEAAQLLLWRGVQQGDVRLVLQALAVGADINAAYTTQEANELVEGARSALHSMEPGPSTPSPRRDDGAVTVLHAAAAQGGGVVLLEFLLQNGAAFERADPHGRTPLHYAIIHENHDIAKVLLRRGAGTSGRDEAGRTALDVVVMKGRVADEELFLLLTSSSK